jgi:hypothetical protein
LGKKRVLKTAGLMDGKMVGWMVELAAGPMDVAKDLKLADMKAQIMVVWTVSKLKS